MLAIPRRLDGYLVGITADRRWEEQAELLTGRGAAVLHGPTIRTLALGPEVGMRAATERAITDPAGVLIANTGIGLRGWFAAADSWGVGDALFDALAGARIYARGPKAVAAVQQWGLTVVASAPSERLDELVGIVAAAEPLAGTKVLFQQHGEDAPAVVGAFERLGATVDHLPVYEWTRPHDAKPALRLIEAIVARRVHAVTVTSAPAVRNLVAIAAEHDLGEPLRQAFRSGSVLLAGVGPGCAVAAGEAGLGAVVVPDRFRVGPMLRRLADVLLATEQVVEVGGRILVLRGTRAEVDGVPMSLAGREAGVLAALAARAGKVVTKEALRRDVWGDDGDARVVEVTIGRLRRRLGDLGSRISSVPRRGYLLDAAVPIRTNGMNGAFRTATDPDPQLFRMRRQVDASG